MSLVFYFKSQLILRCNSNTILRAKNTGICTDSKLQSLPRLIEITFQRTREHQHVGASLFYSSSLKN